MPGVSDGAWSGGLVGGGSMLGSRSTSGACGSSGGTTGGVGDGGPVGVGSCGRVGSGPAFVVSFRCSIEYTSCAHRNLFCWKTVHGPCHAHPVPVRSMLIHERPHERNVTSAQTGGSDMVNKDEVAGKAEQLKGKVK